MFCTQCSCREWFSGVAGFIHKEPGEPSPWLTVISGGLSMELREAATAGSAATEEAEGYRTAEREWEKQAAPKKII